MALETFDLIPYGLGCHFCLLPNLDGTRPFRFEQNDATRYTKTMAVACKETCHELKTLRIAQYQFLNFHVSLAFERDEDTIL